LPRCQQIFGNGRQPVRRTVLIRITQIGAPMQILPAGIVFLV
jgi:hypothetical protein